MFRAQQAARQAARGSTRRIRRWISDSQTTAAAAISTTPAEQRFPIENNISAPVTQQDIKHLLATLHTLSTGMPKQLLSVNGEAKANLVMNANWRDAAVFQDYRQEGKTWIRSTSLASASGSEALDPYYSDEAELEEEKAPEVDSHQDHVHNMMQEHATKEMMENPGDVSADNSQNGLHKNMEAQVEVTPPTAMENSTIGVECPVKQMESKLSCALSRSKLERAFALFEEATAEHGMELDLELVRTLFRRATYSHPFHTYHLLHHLLQRINHPAEEEELAWLYRGMIYAIRSLDPTKMRHGEIRSLVGTVTEEIDQLSESLQLQCLPDLVTALVMQRSAKMGMWANRYYNKMMKMGVEVQPTYLEHLLTYSKYNKSNMLPFHDVIKRVVQAGLRPYPHVVIRAVENMYPYTSDAKGTYIALEAVLNLQLQTLQLHREQEEEKSQIQNQMAEINPQENAEEFEKLRQRLNLMRDPDSYAMDITSLECMADAATKRNFVPLILLTWDALGLMGLEPTEALYESTVLCFAKNPDLIENCFDVMNDMQRSYTPARPFIRAFGVTLRDDPDCIAKADKLVDAFRNFEQDAMDCTPAILNGMMAAHSWRGNITRCLDLLDAFRDNGWSPDEDSFSYLLESVGKAARRLDRNKNMGRRGKNALTDSYFEAAESVLSRMEKAKDQNGNPVPLNHHVVRNYVEFLCTLDEVETAGLVATDFLQQGGNQSQLVDNKTLWRVALAHAKNGNYDQARQFAASTSEILPFMEAKIDSLEQHNKNQSDPSDFSGGETPVDPDTNLGPAAVSSMDDSTASQS